MIGMPGVVPWFASVRDPRLSKSFREMVLTADVTLAIPSSAQLSGLAERLRRRTGVEGVVMAAGGAESLSEVGVRFPD